MKPKKNYDDPLNESIKATQCAKQQRHHTYTSQNIGIKLDQWFECVNLRKNSSHIKVAKYCMVFMSAKFKNHAFSIVFDFDLSFFLFCVWLVKAIIINVSAI